MSAGLTAATMAVLELLLTRRTSVRRGKEGKTKQGLVLRISASKQEEASGTTNRVFNTRGTPPGNGSAEQYQHFRFLFTTRVANLPAQVFPQ